MQEAARRPPSPVAINLALCLAVASLAPTPAHSQEDATALSLAEIAAGQLLRRTPGGLLPLPVTDLHVTLEVTGMMVHGTVVQSFHNPTGEVIETLYAFPLPERAAVHHMEIRIGERRIVSVIQEKEEARRTYEAAKRDGRKAALVEQRRPNLFTTDVANINPDELVEVRLEYVQELSYEDGEFRLDFPLTFTPRFDPGGGVSVESDAHNPPSAAAVVAAFPTAHVVARVLPGFPLQSGDVFSPSHQVVTRWEGDALVVEPRHGGIRADRDFRLRWRPQLGSEPRSALFIEDRPDGRYLMLMVVPPLEDVGTGIGLPTETLFVIDTSGSMAGMSIAGARQALRSALQRLRPGDTFALLEFDDEVRIFHEEFLPAESAEISRALRWVDRLDAGGGTRIQHALTRAIDLIGSGDPSRASRIVFLTDGAVSNEAQVFSRILAGLGEVRLHTLGIGAAPNRYLMRRMARHGRGLCDFIASDLEASAGVDSFFSRLDRPVMTGLSLEVIADGAVDLHPDPLHDLHAGEALFASLRLEPGAALERVVLRGNTVLGPLQRVVDLPRGAPASSGVATRWARARVADLMDRLHEGADPPTIREQIIQVALPFHMVTRFTSLVAVEQFPTAVADSTTVRVASATPAGSLPMGATLGPLWTRIGAILSLLGGALLLRGLQVPQALRARSNPPGKRAP